jgi:diaminopimelate epimerase
MIPFVKMQGLGNDFIVMDLRAGLELPLGAAALARALCDRHFGIGADGVLLIHPPASAAALARMQVINADGSEAEMCGNGLRCVVRHLWRPDLDRPEMAIDTGAGTLLCQVEDGPTGPLILVDMGAPQAAPAPLTVEADGRAFQGIGVNLGNPHLVIFLPPGEALRPCAERYGPILERHPLFPQRTNVEFAHLGEPDRIDLVVWERGCGITLACGTGACATTLAAAQAGRSPGPFQEIHLPGGVLYVRIDENGHALMKGPAVPVFSGVLDPAALP